MDEIKKIISAAQANNSDAMMDLIVKFDPIIRKYTRMMKYDEDFRSDLTLHLIEIINSIDLGKLKIQNDCSIINYIKKSLHHQYILLSKKQKIYRNHENFFEYEDIEGWLGEDHSTEDNINSMITDNLMKSVLSEREYICVKLMIVDGMSSAEAAKILNITRQTVNEAKIRGLSKLKAVLTK